MKLNNKGITTVEVIICFVLVVVITAAMYSTISSFNERRIYEENKEKIVSYKNLLTKAIQDDFVKIGLTHANYTKEVASDGTVTHTLNCNLKDGTNRDIVYPINTETRELFNDVILTEYEKQTSK